MLDPLAPAARLRQLLAAEGCRLMPCCFDGLSARLVERAGFPFTFMSGFSVAAARAALPDTGLLTVSEMLEAGRAICEAVSIPVIGDGDTGHGNDANVRRTMRQFARAGFAGIMLEDQLAPKRCGHTGVREVVSREEAVGRIRAAVPGWRMANMLEGGITPLLPPERLAAIGYRVAAYPLTLLACAARAMERALADLAAGRIPEERMEFAELRRLVGFDTYDALLER